MTTRSAILTLLHAPEVGNSDKENALYRYHVRPSICLNPSIRVETGGQTWNFHYSMSGNCNCGYKLDTNGHLKRFCVQLQRNFAKYLRTRKLL
jgi:hypothetical protein